MTTTDHNPDRTADVLIVGAGASGAAVATLLSEAGFDVVCIEQGHWQDSFKYPTVERDYELQAMSSWSINPNKRRLPEDYPTNVDNSAVDPVMFNGVGGSTILWAAHTPRLLPSDFRVKSLDGVADDWPISYEDLEPWYDLNDQVMGCAGIAGDPANPPRAGRPMLPIPIGKDGEMMAGAFDRLGWHWWPSENYINSTRFGEGRDVCNFCGHNMMGCYQRAKSSTDITYWPRAIDQGTELVTDARVREITTDTSGRVTGVNYLDAEGTDHHRSARAVVMAANGVGTPRMLLLSDSDRHPNGLANSSELVGKNLMFHVFGQVSGAFPDRRSPWMGPAVNIINSQEFYETDPARGFLRGYMLRVNRPQGPASIARGGSVERVPWGAGHHETMKRRFTNTVGIGIMGEDLPDEHNSVSLDERLTDSSGLPAPKITYSVSENSRALVDHGIAQGRIVMQEAGASEVIVNRQVRETGWHLLGTARMGDDPKRSVVDNYGQSHDIDNLFIVDGSVFVTAGAVNPTPTIQAIALRTADYIANERNDLKA
ncbi:MAG: GMC family oxidoreductase [Dehalococcoidia bacterium]|jgi:choline dehydrogenase-like flavoprotein|nr:GMC family oxidoreductase [SAR202 cluster bacterium]MDP7212896.1 GMC family oxidoreductase [Dehalococcoidia bacterium]HJN53381.1 GMC family oxidoreductase [Pseudomonadales bacterium]|tara:strand:+ start:1202 stop:2827 length:1626 start_codon:yes stop_codon:yes gene_type:complete